MLRHSRYMDLSLMPGPVKGAQTQLTGNKSRNISNAHPHYKRDYIVPKYGGPIVIYSAWKVCPNISREHSKLKKIPKPSQDKHNNCPVGQVIAESSTTPRCTICFNTKWSKYRDDCRRSSKTEYNLQRRQGLRCSVYKAMPRIEI